MVFRWVAMLAIAFGWLGAVPHVAALQQDGLDDDTYTSEEYGWSVQFDDRTWEADELDTADYVGVRLSSDIGFVDVGVYIDLEDLDAGECLEALDRFYTGGETWEDLEPARRLDLPETDRDAEAELYEGTLVLDDGDLDAVLYLECRDADGAPLSVELTALADEYEDAIPDVEDLLAAIEIGGSGAQDDPRDEPEDEPADDPSDEPEDEPADAAEGHIANDQLGRDLDGSLDDGSYTSELGYTVTWDDEAWEADPEPEDGSGVTLVGLDEDVRVSFAAYEDPSIEDCIGAEVAAIEANPDFLSVNRSSGTRPPASADDAVGRLFRAVEDTTQQGRFILYTECRPLAEEGEGGDPVFLTVNAQSDEAAFRTTRGLMEALLAGVSIGDEPVDEPADDPTEEPADEPEDEPTEEPSDEPEDKPEDKPEDEPTEEPADDPEDEPADEPVDLGETDIEGRVYVGDLFPVRFEWTDYWIVQEVVDEDIREGVRFQSVGGFASIVMVDTPAGYGIDECLADNVDAWEAQMPDLEEFTPPAGQEIAWPRGAEVAQSVGTITFEDGTTQVIVNSAGCIELGDGEDYLIMSMQAYDFLYEPHTLGFNEILESIQIAAASGGDDRGDTRDDDPADEPSTGGDIGETDLDAGVYAGAGGSYGFEWDSSFWTTATDEQGLVTLSTTDELSTVFHSVRSFEASDGATAQTCVASTLDIFSDSLPDLADYSPPAGVDIEWPSGWANAWVAGSVALNDGSTVMRTIAAGCLEVTPGEIYLQFVFLSYEPLLVETVPQFNEVLESFRFASGGVRSPDVAAGHTAVLRRGAALLR